MNNTASLTPSVMVDPQFYGADDAAPFPGATWHAGDPDKLVSHNDIYAPTAPAAPDDDAMILEEIIAFIRRFVIYADPVHYDLSALFVYHTWAFDAAYATPYLYLKSAEPQCGKTRALEIFELLCRNASKTANMSEGALYAKVESQQPTLLLDEVDAIFSGASNEGLRGMLNSGYKQGGNAERQTMGKGGVRETVQYSTFCPKALAGIDNGMIPATIADRSMVFDLKRKKRTENVERLNYRIVTPQAEELKERIKHSARRNLERLATMNPADIETISDRAFEISEPLLAIGMLFPGWTERAQNAIIHIFSQDKPTETIGVKALRVARDLFSDGDRDRISSAEFAAAMEIPSTPKASRILTPYGIQTTTVVFPGGSRAKGYHKHQFEDAWERYL